jgi:predicted membrane protein
MSNFVKTMSNDQVKKRLPFGILMILLGAALLLHNLQLLPPAIPGYVFSWKMLLILIGVLHLFFSHKPFGGIVLIGVGSYFIIPEVLGIPVQDVRLFWPAIFILVGLSIVFGRSGKKRKWFSDTKTAVNSDTIEVSTVMSGENRIISSYNFTGGSISAVMGGVELDLTNCTLAKNAALDISIVMGGLELIVPREWNVRSEVTPVLGGVEDSEYSKSDVYIDPAAELVLRGKIVMGGIEIKRM